MKDLRVSRFGKRDAPDTAPIKSGGGDSRETRGGGRGRGRGGSEGGMLSISILITLNSC